jgi:hypothetical protein
MSSGRSKREIALIIATGGSGLVLTGLLAWAIVKVGQPQHVLLLFFAPFLPLAFASAFALFKRKSIGAWGSLAFFALQVVVVERDGAAFWPQYSFGLVIEVFRSAIWEVNVGVSSLILALLAVGTIRQYWEARILSQMGVVEPLLPPNTSFERTREG